MVRKKKAKGKPDYRMAWFLAVLGTIAFGFGAWGAYNGWLTQKWPRAEAEIVDATLTHHQRETRDVQRPDRWTTFDVHYLYRIDGKVYLGGGIEPYSFGMQNSAGAKKMADAYPVGAKTQVAYNQQDVYEAYLMPGPSSFSLILLALGVVFWLVALLARRMIRLGPEDPDDQEPKMPAKKPVTLDPQIADYYRKPGNEKS
ncbi:DUF3592 domain-containing protein [Microbacteriaceae bacterium K1510]|nr:DUF3592 domain-containing protein [Microbacteriaceae bacterium K1510]